MVVFLVSTFILQLHELRCLLIALEDEYGIKFSPQSDNAKAIYESNACHFPMRYP